VQGRGKPDRQRRLAALAVNANPINSVFDLNISPTTVIDLPCRHLSSERQDAGEDEKGTEPFGPFGDFNGSCQCLKGKGTNPPIVEPNVIFDGTANNFQELVDHVAITLLFDT
jgi:hypothetical protein